MTPPYPTNQYGFRDSNRFACPESPWLYPGSMIFSGLLKHVVWIANRRFWASMIFPYDFASVAGQNKLVDGSGTAAIQLVRGML